MKTTIQKTILAVMVCVALAGASASRGALALGTWNTAYSINFDSTVSDVSNGQFTGAGFQSSPTAGQLDSDSWAATGMSDGALAFGGTQTTAGTDYTRGTSAGNVVPGGFYAFTVGTGNNALGIQPGNADWTPGTLTLKIQNSTGKTVSSLIISYDIYVRNDQNMANSFNFSHSANDSTYTSVGALDYTSTAAADGSPSWVQNPKNTTLTGLSIADNAFYYVRWGGDEVSGSGKMDEFALDNINLTPVPEPITWALVVFGGLMGGIQVVRRFVVGKAQ